MTNLEYYKVIISYTLLIKPEEPPLQKKLDHVGGKEAKKLLPLQILPIQKG
jgi:hypothetical protein|tara:strand:- start:8549 stop:8701 length:153 start_codon:yes stop_codon:yes gene_type:complete